MILARYFSGDANPEEAMALHEWLNVTAENKRMYDGMSSIWYAASKKTYEVPSKTEAWEELKSKLTISNNQLVARQKVFRNLMIAASVLISATIISILLYLNSHPVSSTSVVQITRSSNESQPMNLPDSSSVFLDKKGSLRHPEIFEKDNRSVYLNGNGYFNIMQKNRQPFIIALGELTVEVVGTSFAIFQDSISRYAEVAVESGIVKLYSARDTIQVRAGQTARYSFLENEFDLKNSVDINSFSYATRRFSFQDLSLHEITGYLKNAFGVEVTFSNQSIQQCRMSADFDNESLDYISRVISSTLNLQYSIDQNTVYFSGDACQ